MLLIVLGLLLIPIIAVLLLLGWYALLARTLPSGASGVRALFGDHDKLLDPVDRESNGGNSYESGGEHARYAMAAERQARDD